MTDMPMMLHLHKSVHKQDQLFWKNSFRNTTRVSNSLDPDQARHLVGPDLGQTFCKGYQS